MKTVELTHAEVLKLISNGTFWRGCSCSLCEDLRVKLAAKFPTIANDLARGERPS